MKRLTIIFALFILLAGLVPMALAQEPALNVALESNGVVSSTLEASNTPGAIL